MNTVKRFLSFLFQCYSCCLYENILEKRNEAEFLPKIKDFTFYIVTTPCHLDELESAGFDLSKGDHGARTMLEQGALAGVLFVNKELASMEWAATTIQANSAINIYPLKIDFSQKEAYASVVWTNPKYRRNGLHSYVYFKIYDFLREQGIKKVKSIVASDNSPALRAHDRFAPQEKIYGRGYYLKILGLRYWKESLFSRQYRNVYRNIPSLPEGPD